ncbi:hypothetical protein [Luteolibacter sp. AS25]|uniref:hypothetical protein n=1 Tax=Luteolibacter sp. AS25 TaxID=3135776 RepID=UPI00398A98D2
MLYTKIDFILAVDADEAQAIEAFEMLKKLGVRNYSPEFTEQSKECLKVIRGFPLKDLQKATEEMLDY